MPVTTRSQRTQEKTEASFWKTKHITDLLFNPEYFCKTSGLFVVAEVILCFAIIWRIPYTEIDWSTYMQQVECFLINGTRDYAMIGGDTGPIVYPAGHLYIYTVLYQLTNSGTSIRIGQYLFAIFYILTLLVVIAIFRKSAKIPPYVLLIICCTSYRVHSIFVLRLFNDPIAMLIFYMAVLLWLYDYWTIGCIFYSLAVSVKMNILLFSPALFVILIITQGYIRTAVHIFNCALVQLLLAVPFLMSHPVNYVLRSFNLGRIFFYKWTVNWRFLPENLFVDKRFHLFLLVVHLVVLLLFASFCWFKNRGGMWKLLKSGRKIKLGKNEMLFSLFSANFIGMVFSRTLHYQFFCWYYHSLPFLLWSTKYPSILRLLVLLLIEVMWNIYPSTNISSLSLHILHFIILFGIIWSRNDRKVHND